MVDDNTNSEVVVPETEPGPIVDGLQTQRHREARWLHLFLYIITALIFAFFFVLAGRWVYHKAHRSSSVNVTPASNHVPTPPGSKAPSSSTSNTQNSQPSGSSTAGTTNNPTSPSTTPAQPPKSTPLPNSGPGDTVAIFIGTSLLIGGTHFIVSLYRDR
jgi:hypothetical protein